MMKKITFLLFTVITINIIAQTQISSSNLFEAGANTNWPHILVAATNDDTNSQLSQTLEINITSLPAGGANYRVFKTTANGGDFFGNATALSVGSNTINVTAVSFNRTVKFQFSSGDIEFDAISLNDTDTDQEIATSNLFTAGANTNWPHILTAATNDNPDSQEAQTLEIYITSVPHEGANYRVYKTTANGGDFFGTPQPLMLGTNTITVTGVSFNRSVKFQFNSGDVVFDAIALNDSENAISIGTSDLFSQTSNANWPYVFQVASISDDDSQLEQVVELNIVSVPAQGANYRVVKTVANGNLNFGAPQPITLGKQSKTIAAVGFNRDVKFQFSSGDIIFDELSVNGNTSLGLEDFSATSISIFPNPVSNLINISGIENVKSIKVYSILGSLEKEVFNTNLIDVSDLSTGIHLIRVDNGTIFSKKFIKQ